ncbi:MAG: RNA pyrophosphohydrolase [Methyloceanibacter sp.]
MTTERELPYRPCVGVMLINAQGHVFVGRRADRVGAPEGLGQWWQMPQGGMDDGEDPETAARRELEEETGVRRARFIGRSRQWYAYDLPGELLGIAWQGRYRGQTQLWFAARFEGEESEIDLAPKAGHEREFDAWRWVPLTLVATLVVPFKRQVYEGVIQEFERLVLTP